MSDVPVPSLRNVLNILRDRDGGESDLPIGLVALLEEVFLCQKAVSEAYAGRNVFRNRANHAYVESEAGSQTERRQVQSLFRMIHDDTQDASTRGLLHVDDEAIWVPTFEAPNQNEQGVGQRGRRADLIGLDKEGRLFVFEAKAADNGNDTPLSAIVEGLDYLACLLRSGNLEMIEDDLDRIHSSQGYPDGFATNVDPDQKPVVAVMAPQPYWDRFDGSGTKRGEGWQSLMGVKSELFDIQFLCGEFNNQKWTSVSPASLS